MQRLLKDIETSLIDVVVNYHKIDRLTRSLSDFAKLVELFDKKTISFVAVTQQFNTTTSMGRLTLNVLLSFLFNLSVNSRQRGYAIKSQLRAKKENGPAAACHLVTIPRIKSSSSITTKPIP